MRRVSLWLTGLMLVLAVAACGAGGGNPAETASHAGSTGRGGAGQAAGVSPGWRVVQALPSEPGSGQPGGGSNEMVSVAAAGARDVWAVGDLCPQQCAASDSTLVEHWAGAGWRTIPPPPGRGPLIPPTVISASSATNVWVFGDTVATTTQVSRWNGSRWASFRFPRQLLTTAAAVFSRTDVWAFGEKFIPSTASSRPYVVRFTGRRWLQVPSPLVPQAASAVAPDDIWTVGTLTGPGQVWAAAHWNGSRWRTLRFPPLPAAVATRAEIGNAAIQAFSPRDAWVDIGLTTATDSYGIIVLHWNGQAWSSVPVPYQTQAAGAISGDGRGGIWMYAIGLPAPAGAGTYLYHYSSGRWSRQAAPALGGVATEMGVLSWRPGARSGWAAASTGNRGALLRYFP
ncbi:MAG TPA: hypothetical protein VG123_19785 [Streptosporangiaceae bacterium]|nr:hypothetical protein [Streptosporangiaceae bacterium]